jgi:hypothetical protein
VCILSLISSHPLTSPPLQLSSSSPPGLIPYFCHPLMNSAVTSAGRPKFTALTSRPEARARLTWTG